MCSNRRNHIAYGYALVNGDANKHAATRYSYAFAHCYTFADKYAATRDDLTKIRGIGPTYASRLYADGITTYAALSQLTPAEIKAIVAPGRTGNFIDAEAWIAQAQTLAQDP